MPILPCFLLLAATMQQPVDLPRLEDEAVRHAREYLHINTSLDQAHVGRQAGARLDAATRLRGQSVDSRVSSRR
jgi:hypothetical protein